jgi:mono/diheme cytochrome c family protein
MKLTGINTLNLLVTGGLLTSLFGLGACTGDKTSPGIEYAPDMYHSVPYDPLSQIEKNPHTKDGKNLIEPVKNTIARGQMDFIYPYANTPEDYERAGVELKIPAGIDSSEATVAEGKAIYLQYCAVCHGENGMADGPIVAAEKFPAPPAYNSDRLKNLPAGKMYHSITYGKNLMGSYASQVSPKERWQIIRFIQTLQKQ